MTESGKELFEKAIKVDFELETITLSHERYVGEKRRLTEERRTCFHQAVNALLKEANTTDLVSALRYFDDLAPSCPMIEGNTTGNPKAEQAEFSEKAEAAFVRNVIAKAENLLKKASSNDTKIPYQFRNQWLEKAIRLIIGLNDPLNRDTWKFPALKSKKDIYKLLADCYLKRGLSILPKGKGLSAPEKKLEAMRKALDWAESACTEDTSDLNVNFTKIQSLYELYRLNADEYAELLKNALGKLIGLPAFHPSDPFHYFCLSLYCRSKEAPDPGSDKLIFDFEVGEAPNGKEYPYLPLIRAQAGARLLGQNLISQNDFKLKSRAVIRKLARLELHSRVWEDTVQFIKELRDETIDGWEGLAWTAWKICQKKERQMGFGLQIRQYWSRLSDLYAMAYEGAISQGKIEKAVQVVDSLKGRTTLTWGEMDVFLAKQTGKNAARRNKWRKSYFTGEAQAAMGDYVSGYRNLLRGLPEEFRPSKKSLPVTHIPKGWAAVHLYLEQVKHNKINLYALVGRKDSSGKKDAVWNTEGPFDTIPLWDAYQNWLSQNRTNSIGSAKSLVALCKAIGDCLPFVFNMKVEGIIFVPHGFTHLLPLHTAKNKDGGYLFESTFSVYLPAWSLAPYIRLKKGKPPNKRYLLRYHKAGSRDIAPYQPLIQQKIWNHTLDYDKVHQNTLAELGHGFMQDGPPEWLSILCHGKADALYPFDSKLMLGEEGISFLDLQLTKLDLTGSKVLLGACDTEMTPVKTLELDEHLSLAGAFLNKGADMVMGSLWECEATLVRELTESALKNQEPLWKVVQGLQRGWFNKEVPPAYWYPNPGTFPFLAPELRLYYIAPFRVLGYPFP